MSKTTPKGSTYEMKNHQCFHLKWSDQDPSKPQCCAPTSCTRHVKLPQHVALTGINDHVSAHVRVILMTGGVDLEEHVVRSNLSELQSEGPLISQYPNKKHLLPLENQVSVFVRVLTMTKSYTWPWDRIIHLDMDPNQSHTPTLQHFLYRKAREQLRVEGHLSFVKCLAAFFHSGDIPLEKCSQPRQPQREALMNTQIISAILEVIQA